MTYSVANFSAISCSLQHVMFEWSFADLSTG